MKRRGVSLIEALVASTVLVVVIGGLMQSAVSVNKVSTFSTTMPSVQDEAVRVVNLISTNTRRAPLCVAKSGCIIDSAVHEASATQLTVYTATTGSKETYRLNNGTFEVLTGNTVTTSIPNVTSLQFLYSTIADSSYTTAAPRGWSSSVAEADRPKIAAIQVKATVSRGGLTGSYGTAIRLRNSPKMTGATR